MKSRELTFGIATGTKNEYENQIVNIALVINYHIFPLGKNGKTISQRRIFGSMWIFISRISGSLIGTDTVTYIELHTKYLALFGIKRVIKFLCLA